MLWALLCSKPATSAVVWLLVAVLVLASIGRAVTHAISLNQGSQLFKVHDALIRLWPEALRARRSRMRGR